MPLSRWRSTEERLATHTPLDGDAHRSIDACDKSDELLEREPFEPPAPEIRHARLISADEVRGVDLIPALEPLDDELRELSLELGDRVVVSMGHG